MTAWKMYNIKSVNPQQAKSIYNFNNIKEKLQILLLLLGTQKFFKHNQLALK